MTVKEAIKNETFINEFATFANDVFYHYGGYDDVYEQFAQTQSGISDPTSGLSYYQFSEDEILILLDYCEENGLLED